VVAFSTNDISVADPADPGQLDVAGFDTATPQLISDFIAGTL
jgi:60 kDa SS-A/Ro ribonucleoprotein